MSRVTKNLSTSAISGHEAGDSEHLEMYIYNRVARLDSAFFITELLSSFSEEESGPAL